LCFVGRSDKNDFSMSMSASHGTEEPPRKPRMASRFRLGSHFGMIHFSAVHLLISLVALLVAAPFLEHFQNGDTIEAILMTLVLGLSVLAVGGSRRTLLGMSALAVPGLLCKWLNQLRPDLIPPSWFLFGGLAFCVVVVWRLLRFVLHSLRVDNEVLCASISAYLLLGLVWAFGYMLVGLANPSAFSFTLPSAIHETMTSRNAYYFSFVTLSTVGYGDIVPVNGGARMLAMTEALTGMMYVAVFIARLVALQTAALTQSPVRNPDNDKT
jgi:voltage-gated potassium channel